MTQTMLQLRPQLPVQAKFGPRWERSGKGTAIGWIDYSEEHDLLWIVAEQSTGEVWCVPNQHIRMQTNASLGRVGGGA